MAMRRPRIKPQANIQLNAKRKSKTIETKPKNSESDNIGVTVEDVPVDQRGEKVGALVVEEKQQQQCIPSNNDVGEDVIGKEVISSLGIDASDTNVRSENNINNATNNVVNDYGVETQKGGVVTKEVKNSLKAGTDQKNENFNDAEAFKFPPKVGYQRSISHSVGRMRPESRCSVFSDTNISNHKSRKTEDHRVSLKREFEARFVNGVPDKACLKMSEKKEKDVEAAEEPEEEANKLKQLKEIAAKETKKRKCVRSAADGVLKGGNVYQNENEPKAKKPRNSNNNTRRSETATKTTIATKAKQISDANEPSLNENDNLLRTE